MLITLMAKQQDESELCFAASSALSQHLNDSHKILKAHRTQDL